MVEAFLVAAIAGMVAGVSVGWINGKILKFKKQRNIFKTLWSKRSRASSSDLNVNVEPQLNKTCLGSWNCIQVQEAWVTPLKNLVGR